MPTPEKEPAAGLSTAPRTTRFGGNGSNVSLPPPRPSAVAAPDPASLGSFRWFTPEGVAARRLFRQHPAPIPA